MPTSRAVGDNDPAAANSSMYVRPSRLSSKASEPGLVLRTVTGFAVGFALGISLGELGIPHIFGYGRFILVVPTGVLGALLAHSRARSLFTWIAMSSVVTMIAIAFTPVVVPFARDAVRRDAVPSRADAIVVLSAGVTEDGMLNQQGLDRLLKGVELARAGVAPRIVLTRDARRLSGQWVTAAADQSRIAGFAEGVQLITTDLVSSTREEALKTKALANRNGWKSIVLVTSPFHSRRACRTFERAGLAVSCVPADSRDISVVNLSGPGNRLGAFAMLIYEFAGTIRYRSSGWL